MQIVIDISEDLYTYMQSRCKYQNKGDKGLSKFEEAGVAIKNGTPLPKEHGRLKDIDDLDVTTIETNDYDGNEVLDVVLKEDIDDAPTIIPADAESEVEE